jgi:hypothetical protein
MLKKLLLFSFMASNAIAQTTIPNLDFENWVMSASGRYEDPTPTTIWATPNYAMDLILGNPSTSLVQKSTDAHGGSYAALMKSRSIVGNFAGATLFTGYLNTTSPFSPVPYLGMPFTGRPVALKGWYKYAPVNGDSSNIYIKLTKWNTATNTRDLVGYVEKRDYSAVSSYSPFNLTINYTSTDQPDSITLVFSASAGAEQSVGEVGSSLWVDDVVLDYGANAIHETANPISIQCYPNPFSNRITLQSSDSHLTYTINTLYGQVVMTTEKDYFDTRHLRQGLYVLDAKDSQGKKVFSQVISKIE